MQETTSAVELLIVQHPSEAKHVKNTGWLLHRCVQPSRLVVAEILSAQAWQSLLQSPWSAAGPKPRSVLLYPIHEGTALAPAPVWQPAAASAGQPLRLVLLDATWRKSRKMLYNNPALQALPRLALEVDGHASAYGTWRKAERAGQLSSFEAAWLALGQLAAWPEAQAAMRAEQGANIFVNWLQLASQRP